MMSNVVLVYDNNVMSSSICVYLSVLLCVLSWILLSQSLMHVVDVCDDHLCVFWWGLCVCVAAILCMLLDNLRVSSPILFSLLARRLMHHHTGHALACVCTWLW